MATTPHSSRNLSLFSIQLSAISSQQTGLSYFYKLDMRWRIGNLLAILLHARDVHFDRFTNELAKLFQRFANRDAAR